MEKLKIATFNANSIRARQGIILDWLAAESPDVLCVQETKVQDADFPSDAYRAAGYASAFIGQKSYNGVAMLSRAPLDNVMRGLGDGAEEPEQARLIAGACRGVPIVNTYVPQGFEPGTDKFTYKLEWLQRLESFFTKHFSPDKPLIWTGDFNIAPAPQDVYDPDKMRGSCGFHPDEHAALERLRAWGFTDIFRKFVPEAQQYTFWDYRLRGGLSRNLGWRIDHIWATAPLAEQAARAWIDTAPRKLEKPSDHTFLIAEFDIG
jgi:exodeoxyribonuclease-3